MEEFNVKTAKELVNRAKDGEFISRGQVIDKIKATAKQGGTEITIENLPQSISAWLVSNEFNVEGDKITW